MAFGGSKTPSPGSSLSRKSSFANLFRKSDVSGSPDSQSGGGGSGKKKSATSSIASRETIEGVQERSHSRSKSKERCSGSSTSSGKKSVFNLFGKKKMETKSVAGKESEEPPPKLDLQFMFNSGTDSSRKAADEGDYIFIPLKDPSDPPYDLDTENEIETLNLEEETVNNQKPFQSVDDNVNAEKREKIESDCRAAVVSTEMTESSAIKGSIGHDRRDEEQEQLILNKSDLKQSRIMCSEPHLQVQKSESSSSEQKEPQHLVEETEAEVFVHEKSSDKRAEEEIVAPIALDKESILNADEEKTVKEEVMTVTADGIRKLQLPPEPGDLDDDHERKGLVYQESFEDELPYVPTTLPLERSLGVPIIPVKQRVSEIKTCPIERPRSTTPINPTTLEDFVASKEPTSISEEEKMKISLPRDDSVTSKGKSPRKYSAKGKSWFEFAEEGLQSPRDHRKSSLKTSPSPPPLPPKSPPLTASVPPTTSSRINFEALPEKKKLPKRIVTVPSLRNTEDCRNAAPHRTGSPGLGNVVYNYVSPEECQCECHDHNASHHDKSDSKKGTRNVLSSSPRQVNSEFISILPRKNSVTNVMVPRKSEISGCEYCDVGKEMSENEDNVEGRPLLGENSDEETESETEFPQEKQQCRFGGKNESVRGNENGGAVPKQDDWKNLKCDKKMKPEKFSPSSSGSSSERISSSESATALCNDPPNSQEKKIISKPFEMDLQVNSNDSSLLSQEDLISSSDSSSSSRH